MKYEYLTGVRSYSTASTLRCGSNFELCLLHYSLFLSPSNDFMRSIRDVTCHDNQQLKHQIQKSRDSLIYTTVWQVSVDFARIWCFKRLDRLDKIDYNLYSPQLHSRQLDNHKRGFRSVGFRRHNEGFAGGYPSVSCRFCQWMSFDANLTRRMTATSLLGTESEMVPGSRICKSGHLSSALSPVDRPAASLLPSSPAHLSLRSLLPAAHRGVCYPLFTAASATRCSPRHLLPAVHRCVCYPLLTAASATRCSPRRLLLAHCSLLPRALSECQLGRYWCSSSDRRCKSRFSREVHHISTNTLSNLSSLY